MPKLDDLPRLFEAMVEGNSIRAFCKNEGLNYPAIFILLGASDEIKEQYARARELRGEALAEDALSIGMAAATGQTVNGHKILPDGARVALDAIKWRAGQMSSKTGETKTLRVVDGSEEEILARYDALMKRAREDADASGEG